MDSYRYGCGFFIIIISVRVQSLLLSPGHYKSVHLHVVCMGMCKDNGQDSATPWQDAKCHKLLINYPSRVAYVCALVTAAGTKINKLLSLGNIIALKNRMPLHAYDVHCL